MWVYLIICIKITNGCCFIELLTLSQNPIRNTYPLNHVEPAYQSSKDREGNQSWATIYELHPSNLHEDTTSIFNYRNIKCPLNTLLLLLNTVRKFVCFVNGKIQNYFSFWFLGSRQFVYILWGNFLSWIFRIFSKERKKTFLKGGPFDFQPNWHRFYFCQAKPDKGGWS